MLADCKNFYLLIRRGICNKTFVPPHLNYVATLPCEYEKSKMVKFLYNQHNIINKLRH